MREPPCRARCVCGASPAGGCRGEGPPPPGGSRWLLAGASFVGPGLLRRWGWPPPLLSTLPPLPVGGRAGPSERRRKRSRGHGEVRPHSLGPACTSPALVPFRPQSRPSALGAARLRPGLWEKPRGAAGWAGLGVPCHRSPEPQGVRAWRGVELHLCALHRQRSVKESQALLGICLTSCKAVGYPEPSHSSRYSVVPPAAAGAGAGAASRVDMCFSFSFEIS